ncbi:hypothetical protein Bca4012_057922 [Brassica carinata]
MRLEWLGVLPTRLVRQVKRISISCLCTNQPRLDDHFSQTQPEKMILLMMTLLHLLITVGASVSTPALTIKSPDGDVIDCIDIYKQPAFSNPLLKSHELQEFPTEMPNLEIAADTPNWQYAIGYIQNRGPIYGTRATLNVWEPLVEAADDFSLSQVWLASGSFANGDVNTVEAGWQRDAYNNTGCYGTYCGGFVQTSSTIALEAAITRTSTSGGPQFDITIQIWKDQSSGNWWLGLGRNMELVGYWPAAIFTGLADQAQAVEWGGEVLSKNSTGANTIVRMGSGEFAEKGFRKAAYVCDILVAENNQTLVPVQDFDVQAKLPKYYSIKRSQTKACGKHFYFGGPGHTRSGAVRGTLARALLLLYLAFFLCV